jgi:hypothetical protein
MSYILYMSPSRHLENLEATVFVFSRQSLIQKSYYYLYLQLCE